ncbi:MAG: porin family protein [Ginsengibacter sp.]
MKTLKPLLGIVLSIAIFTKAHSQVYVQGGVNLANITKTASGNTEKNNLLTTFNAGFLGRFGLSKVIDLESGLLLDGRGAKAETYFSNGTSDNYVKTTFNPLYLEVPLNLVLRFPMEKNTNLFIHGGPYAAMGIAGKSKSESKFLGLTSNSSNNIKFSNDDPFTSEQDDATYDKIKRFDFGLNIGGGLDLGKVLLKANYGFGLTKINSTQSNNSADDKNKYRTVSVSLGIPLR